ncbi:MAG TPA: LPXTG cell wall anchor domain-containing protein [Candidatus Saccharimonadales bacterium]|nr:LPXTG cell wall anchor domain-containing protein [Candidatus Saccharimonadales bacterium]
MKRLIFTVLVLIAIAAPVRVMAADQEIICPEPYGGGVVCGIHTPVNTGIGDNLAVVGGVLLVSSLVFLFLSKKFNKVSA